MLLTADKDFGELVFRLHRATHGVALVRLPGVSLALKAQIVSDVLRTYGQEMQRAFSVIAPGSVRIRADK